MEGDLSMTRPFVRVDKVTFRYGARKKRVLHDLSLEVGENSVTAILGPNGGGKTTLLRMLVNQEPKDSGKLFLSGGGVRVRFQRVEGEWQAPTGPMATWMA